MAISALAIVLSALSFGAVAAQLLPVYEQGYGQFPYYNPTNIPQTKYYFCVSNQNVCKPSGMINYCQTYETTCNIGTTAGTSNNIYAVLANIYCPTWCQKCSSVFNSVCPQAPPSTPVQKCEYTKYTSFSPKVYNGQTAFQCQNPWTVALKPNIVVANPSTDFPAVCQGALIDSTTVLTTLECLSLLEAFKTNSFHYNVSLGEYIWTYDEAQDETVTATFNPSIDPGTSGVVKLTLDKPIQKFSKCIAPACLKSMNSNVRIDRSNCRITGWGSTSNTSPGPTPILRTGNVSVLTAQECSGMLSFLSSFPMKEIPLTYGDKSFVGCTSAPLSQTSSCKGDEGGAVTCAEITTGDQILVGLVKTGGCDFYRGTFFANITTLF